MKKLSEKVLFQGKWLSLVELIYRTKDGKSIAWETVRRKTSPFGVVVIAKLVPSNRFILIKQFRPAVGGYVLGFVAGLADGNPQQALAELKEETGYVGKIVAVSPTLKTGSSIIDDSGMIIHVEVNEKDHRNKNPRQDLEPGEDIEVCLVKRKDIEKFLMKEHKTGTHISANLWYLFVTSEMILKSDKATK